MEVQYSRPKVALVSYLASALHNLGFQPIVINAQVMHDRLFNNGVAHDDDSGVMFLSVPDGIHSDQPYDFVNILFAMENVKPPHLEKILESFGRGEEGIVCVITDLLPSWAIRVAEQRGIPVAGFWPAMHATYSIVKSIPDLIQQRLISSVDVRLQIAPRGSVYPVGPADCKRLDCFDFCDHQGINSYILAEAGRGLGVGGLVLEFYAARNG